jgi:uncharacterized protein YndB with AHSA1/START domain
MSGLGHVLDRTVTIAARRETVFRYFTDSDRFAAWWGETSQIDPRPGGIVHIRHPNAVVAGGRVVEITPVERLVFTFGYESGQPMPIGASRVTITLEESPRGTVVRLRHELPSATARDEHVQGWRYQLAVFANVVAREAHESVGALADRFFAVWGEADAARRRAELEAVAGEALAFRDPYSCTDGLDDLDSTTSTRTSTRHEGSCRASFSPARARPGSARAWRSWTGSSRDRRAAPARGARTSSSSPPTAGSPA